MATKVQLTGGAFQDSKGNVLALGYLIMRLNQDGSIAGTGQICSGVEIKITLNSSGGVDTASPQSVWGNDQMLPANSYYRVFGYNAAGQLAWGPNNQQVNGSGGTFDVGTWTPNTVLSWTPPVQPLVLKTNSVLNGSQVLLNLKPGTNTTIVDDAAGGITIGSTGGTQSGPMPSLANWHIWTAVPNTAFSVGGVGMQLGSGGTIAKINATATDCSYTSTTTGAGAGSNVSVNDSLGQAAATLGIFNNFQARVILPSTANVRVWIGFAAVVAGFSTNTPAVNFLGFRYSSTADTNWQCVASNASTQTTSNSGVAVTTSGFNLSITKTSGNFVFSINGAIVATILSSDGNLPTLATALGPMIWVDNVGLGNAKGVGVSTIYFDTVP